MQLALDYAATAHSLVVMEPPIFNPDGPSPFAKLEALYNSGDKLGAMSAFSQASYGAEWRTLASRVPGGPAQVENDVDTVFHSEAPAMASGDSGPKKAHGSRSRPSTSLAAGGTALRASGCRCGSQAWSSSSCPTRRTPC